MAEKDNLNLQMFMKNITKGSLIERDRLLEYTVGSFYNEVNVFILMNQEQQNTNKNIPH